MNTAIATINPATGETIETFEPLSSAALEQKVARAHAAFRSFRQTPVAERAQKLRRAADILDGEKEQLGQLMTLEMGKTIGSAIAEAQKCATACRYYADNAERLLAPKRSPPTRAGATWPSIRSAWCSPSCRGTSPSGRSSASPRRRSSPATSASSSTPRTSPAARSPSRTSSAGPASRKGSSRRCSSGTDGVPRLIADPRIAAATLTGSENAGRSVGAHAGKHLKKVVLELGGSDPFIVLPSADLNAAVGTAIRARIINNGQSCIAAKRFIVHESIAPEFEQRFVATMRRLRVGDPMDPSVDVGPLATPQIAARARGAGAGRRWPRARSSSPEASG